MASASRSRRCLSSTFQSQLTSAIACVERTSALGDYRYRHSRVETHRWADRGWLKPHAMIEILGALPADDRSGDVYAVRTDRLSAAGDESTVAKQVKGAMTVELRAWDTWQVEGIGCHVREVGVADRLLAAIAVRLLPGLSKPGLRRYRSRPAATPGPQAMKGIR